MMSTPNLLATSPAAWPPIPSQRINKFRERSTAKESSLFFRTSPTSERAPTVILKLVFLPRLALGKPCSSAGETRLAIAHRRTVFPNQRNHLPQLLRHLVAALVPFLQVLFQSPFDDSHPLRRKVLVIESRGRRRLISNFIHQSGHAVSLKRLLASSGE